jgi:hypothetical protein
MEIGRHGVRIGGYFHPAPNSRVITPSNDLEHLVAMRGLEDAANKNGIAGLGCSFHVDSNHGTNELFVGCSVSRELIAVFGELSVESRMNSKK